MIVIRRLGLTAYPQTLERMRAQVNARAAERAAALDELWLTEHEPVFTLGFASQAEHLLDPGSIPIVKTERGGQVTYHGPGQAVAYVLLDLRRRRFGVRELVSRLERGIIDCLAGYGVVGLRKAGAPGIYVQPRTPGTGAVGEPFAKIASIGLKVSAGLTWHGVALNGCMDLSPFRRINPCGYPNLRMTDIKREANAHLGMLMERWEDRWSHASETSGVAGPDPTADLAGRLGAALCTAIDG